MLRFSCVTKSITLYLWENGVHRLQMQFVVIHKNILYRGWQRRRTKNRVSQIDALFTPIVCVKNAIGFHVGYAHGSQMFLGFGVTFHAARRQKTQFVCGRPRFQSLSQGEDPL